MQSIITHLYHYFRVDERTVHTSKIRIINYVCTVEVRSFSPVPTISRSNNRSSDEWIQSVELQLIGALTKISFS